MMDAKARVRFSEGLAVVFGAVLIGFFIYTTVSQRIGVPDVSPVDVGSNGQMIAVSSTTGSESADQSSRHSTSTATTGTTSITASANDPKASSATTNEAAANTKPEGGSGTTQSRNSNGSLLSKTTNLACDTLKPVSTTASEIEKGLSTLPLTKVVTTVYCRS
jgi:hypothetical protein